MPLPPDCTANNTQTVALKFLKFTTNERKEFLIERQEWVRSIFNIPWKIVVDGSRENNGLKMMLTCLGTSAENWKLEVSRLLLKLHFLSTRSVFKSVGKFEFNGKNNTAEVCFTKEEIIDLVRIMYTRSDIYLINVSITVMWTKQVGLSHLFPVSYDFHQRTENSSLLIQTGGERFFVNLQYLAQLSHSFDDIARNLGKLPMDEATGLPLLILDSDSWAFEELLKLLYPSKKMSHSIDHTNVEAIVKLADRFRCPTVLYKCAEAMIKMEQISPVKRLLLCETYHMEWIVEKVVNNLSGNQILTATESPDLEMLSKRTMKLLLIRIAKRVSVRDFM